MCECFQTAVTSLARGLFVLYDLFPRLDSRTERLRKLLTAANCRHCIARTYLLQPSLESAGRTAERIVGARGKYKKWDAYWSGGTPQRFYML